MKKLSVVLAVVVALVLLIGGVVLGFDRGVDVGGAHLMTVQLNEKFNVEDVEEIMAEAGAKNCLVQKILTYVEHSDSYKGGEVAVISFELDEDADIQTVYDNAEKLLGEKYFLKYPAELSNFTSTLTKSKAISMWPVAIVIVIMLAYVFVRFGAKFGFAALANMFITGAATLGIVGIVGVSVTAYTIPALLIACALAYAFTVVFALVLKENTARLDNKCDAFALTVKQSNKLVAVLTAIAVIALAIVLILGGVMLKNFAITALIGIVINAAVAILVMPEMANGSKKA